MRRLSVIAALAAAAVSVSLPTLPAQAAGLVPVTVHAVDTLGQPLPSLVLRVQSGTDTTYVETATTGTDGSVTVDAIPNSTVTVSLDPASALTSSPDGSAIRWLQGRMYHLTTPTPSTHPIQQPYALSTPIGAVGATLTLPLPPIQTRTVRVVTESGAPVAGAWVSAEFTMSAETTAADGTTYRISPEYAGPRAKTDSEGTATFTTWQLEPDEAVVAASGGFVSQIEGVPGGPHVTYQPKPTAQLAQAIPYASWIQATSQVVLPFVPVVTAAASALGTEPGTAAVTATLQQPSSAGTMSPMAGQKVEAWAEGGPTSSAFASTPRLLGTATSTVNGGVSFTLALPAATRVALHLAVGSHTPAFVTAVPRSGTATKPVPPPGKTVSRLLFSRVKYDSSGPDRNTSRSLNQEWFTIRNAGAASASTAGVWVRNRHGQVFRFPRLTLRSGATLRVHTGPGKRLGQQVFWGAHRHRWGNRADRAQLLDAGGRVLDSCAWPPLGSHGVARC